MKIEVVDYEISLISTVRLLTLIFEEKRNLCWEVIKAYVLNLLYKFFDSD